VIPDESGKPALFAAVVVDMTERKRSDEALLRAREELARVTRVSTVGELTTSIAHEINQPLAAVATYAGAAQLRLQHDPPDVERAREALQRTIQEGGARGGDRLAHPCSGEEGASSDGSVGMGLSISRSIVAAHAGRFRAMPNEPRGAVFRFALPTIPSDASK